MQKFSVNDGEGIRTVIFLAGCPLRCKWCSNPESWNENATFCEEAAVADIVRHAERDAVFFRYSKGGVTFSGGEPTVQEGFLRALAGEFYRRGISAWIETCGHFNFSAVKDIFDKMEHVFYDIKCIDSKLHKELTGADNDLILKNAALLHEAGIPVTVRIPAIKNINFTEKNLAETARFMQKKIPGTPIEFLPYHNLGKEKFQQLRLADSFHEFSPPDMREISAAEILFAGFGIKTVEYK